MFNKILVAVDIQEPADSVRLLKAADQLVQQFGSSVHVTTVMPGYGMSIVASYFPPDAKASAKKELESRLAKLVMNNLSVKATTSVSEGKSAQEILKTAKRRKSDLILIGCHSHSKIQDALLGSCGTKVAQNAPCSVMIIRA
ncbi:MAG: universal stress protein YxiE [marine bacterium B5-7]|nr:MAG: universal stress protein YxiE [marine bacterium B5-7]